MKDMFVTILLTCATVVAVIKQEWVIAIAMIGLLLMVAFIHPAKKSNNHADK